MPPEKRDLPATTYVILVIVVAFLALIGAIFTGAGNRLFGGNDSPENQEEISALQTQVAVQATLIAQGGGQVRDSVIVPDQEPEENCAFLLNEQIDQLRLADSVSDALRLAEDYSDHMQNDYRKDETIPAGVVIATDLQNAEISVFPVSPIRNQGGWGLFITTETFVAPNDGTYWCIR